eukprot:2873356-Pyramimonas_sp.AAC.1
MSSCHHRIIIPPILSSSLPDIIIASSPHRHHQHHQRWDHRHSYHPITRSPNHSTIISFYPGARHPKAPHFHTTYTLRPGVLGALNALKSPPPHSPLAVRPCVSYHAGWLAGWLA